MAGALDDVYRVISRKVAGDASGEAWSNVWDTWYPAGVAPTSADAIFTAIATFEQHVHNNDVYVEDLTVYKWQPPGSGALPPLFSLTTHLLGDNATHTTGHWVGSGNPVAGNVTIGLKLLRFLGLRNGRKRFRGALRIGDVTTTSAMRPWEYVGAGGSGTIPAAVDALFATYLGAYSNLTAPGPDPILALVHQHLVPGVGTSRAPGGVQGGVAYADPLSLQIKR